MDVKVKFNASKNRYEGFVDGKMVSRSRHESYVKDQLAKLGFTVGSVTTNMTPKVDEFGILIGLYKVDELSSCPAINTGAVIVTSCNKTLSIVPVKTTD